jgi:hypothetical protein
MYEIIQLDGLRTEFILTEMISKKNGRWVIRNF